MIRCNAELFKIATMCQSNEDTRYYLKGVYVEPHAVKGVTMTATDGHRMLCIHDENGFADESAIVALSPAALKECKGTSKEFRRIAGAARMLVVDGLGATIFDTVPGDADGAECQVMGAVAVTAKCRIDGTFPDYRRVVPSPVDFKVDSRPGHFNGMHLADFGAIAHDLEKAGDNVKNSTLRILGDSPNSPTLVLFLNSPHAFGVIMPIRGDDVETLPAWFSAKPEAATAPIAEPALEAAE